jgi:deoxyxylulose-5-phosphate synthase
MMDAFQNVLLCSAEQHAVTLPRWYGNTGMIVYCNIYSTFHKAYDQIIHDVAQNLP